MPAGMAVCDLALRTCGAASLGALALAVLRLGRPRRKNCDNACSAAVMPQGAYKGKVVWVTGASSGIGKELSVQLAQQGARLILSSRRSEVLQDVAQELAPLLKASGGEVRVLPVDLADLPALPKKAEEALALYGGVMDVLVNNGGYSSRALSRETLGIDNEVAMMNVNFFSYVALAKAVLPTMREQKRGIIINISSLAGKMGVPLRTMYCGAKFALMGWFDALRAEEEGFWKSGITITNACPGSTKTDVARNAVVADGSKMGNSDANIENGLGTEFVCDRILAAAHVGLDEVWIAKWGELRSAYFSQYFPSTFRAEFIRRTEGIVRATMGDEFVNARLS